MDSSEIESQDVREFLDAFKPGTRKVYRSGLRMFLRFYNETRKGKTLEDFLDAIEEDLKKSRRERTRVARKVLREFVRWLGDHQYTPKTIRTYVNSVQSLGQYYGLNISARYISLPTSQPVSSKYPWTLEEVGTFIGQMRKPELKSIAATTFQSGMNIGDVLHLTWGNIRSEYNKKVSPLCFEVTRQKTDVLFLSFVGAWGLSILRKYLSKAGRKQDSDPIYTMSKRTVQWHFQRQAKKWLGNYEGRNPMRVHSLRSAFRTFLGDAGLNETYLEFFMGHRVPEHKRVYVSKSREGWREIYAKYEDALTP